MPKKRGAKRSREVVDPVYCSSDECALGDKTTEDDHVQKIQRLSDRISNLEQAFQRRVEGLEREKQELAQRVACLEHKNRQEKAKRIAAQRAAMASEVEATTARDALLQEQAISACLVDKARALQGELAMANAARHSPTPFDPDAFLTLDENVVC